MLGFAAAPLLFLPRGEQKWSLRTARARHDCSQCRAVPAPGLFNVQPWLSSSQRTFLTLIRESTATAVKGQRKRTAHLCTLMIFMVT